MTDLGTPVGQRSHVARTQRREVVGLEHTVPTRTGDGSIVQMTRGDPERYSRTASSRNSGGYLIHLVDTSTPVRRISCACSQGVHGRGSSPRPQVRGR